MENDFETVKEELRQNEKEEEEKSSKELKNLDQNKIEEIETLSNSIKNDDSVSNGDKENNNPLKKKTNKIMKKQKKKKTDSDLICAFCNLNFADKNELQIHCKSDEHQSLIMSDEGRNWKFRPPPRSSGGAEAYKLCVTVSTQAGICKFGLQCADAHSLEEMNEWRERLNFRQKKAKKAFNLFQSFNNQLMDKLSQTTNVKKILKSDIEDVECTCENQSNVTISSKDTISTWNFKIKSKKCLENVALLSENNGMEEGFKITYIKEFSNDSILRTLTENCDSEWSNPESEEILDSVEYLVKISFHAEIFGTFKQTIVFNFGSEPYLRKDVSIDVKPVEENEEIDSELKKLRNDLIQQTERWDKNNSIIKDFDPPSQIPPPEDQILYQKYPMPQPTTFKPSKSVIDRFLTKSNYKNRMHELLFIEEMAQYEQISMFNVRTKLKISDRYLLLNTTNSSTAKYARPGELFGQMILDGNLSEDTPAGRLILTNCTSLLLKSPVNRKLAYVSEIEDSGKSTLYLRLCQSLVEDFKLKIDDDLQIEVQFQLNRLPLCEMHLAIDKLHDLNLVYPDVISHKFSIPWTPGKHWAEDMTSKLNPKQREAILAITCPLNVTLPPILLIGPYGTGKTFTLAQSILMLLKQEGNKILVCTHSNSAADLYIRDYLDPFITNSNGNSKPKLLRIYYKNRWVQTVHKSVQKYCLIDEARNFMSPSRSDILGCNIVVTTLSTSRLLSTIDLPIGLFTHILIDEAAQAMECEAILPLGLAYPNTTRVVLAGDHMQLSPEVFSSFALDKKFNKSLLERLYDLYPPNFICKIHLIENYRSHESIIEYTSELFYEQKLLASGKQTKHDLWHPLTFFTARGEDVQDPNSTSFYNNSEVYEVVERVAELQRTWPKNWGHRDENSIGIVTPYFDQVQRIRSELRKRRLFGVSVERVLNVQGKQFRAIFLSTVRTRKTCVAHQEDADTDFGFLSNPKLLNTAITRAQSLVAVVGDPVALCSLGKCRRLWERFVKVSNIHKSLYGTTYSALTTMLSFCEVRKKYILDPSAPEFIPKNRREFNFSTREAYLQPLFQSLYKQEMYKSQQQQFLLQQMSQRPTLRPPLGPPPSVFMDPLTPPPWMYYPANPYFPFFPPNPNNLFFLQRVPPPISVAQNFPRPAFFPQSPPKRFPASAQRRPQIPDVRKELNQIQSAVAGSNANESKNFAFLKDGVHFPPIPSTPPPLSRSSPVEKKATKIQENLRPGKTNMELALDVLPSDSDLDVFLQSPQLQMAWHTKLRVTDGESQANLFKEVIVSMQQSPELLQDMKELLKRRANRPKNPKPNSSQNWPMPKSQNQEVLMPSASSADTFYTLANAAQKQKETQKALNDDELVNEVLKSGDDFGGSMSSLSSSPSIPLYKRKSNQEDSNGEKIFDFPSNLLDSTPVDPWTSELSTRSSTLPSSSLSSIWSRTAAANPNGSPTNRTYANVLRQNDLSDPLMKIRQIGTRGSQELYESPSASTSPNPTPQSPFSAFNGKW